MIFKPNLKKGVYYLGTCRNTNIAQWDGDKFIFINYCFHEPYIETVHYYGDVLNDNIDGFIPIKPIIVDFDNIKEEKNSQDYKNSYRNIYKNTNIKNLPNEEWREIEGYDGLYHVSNLGRVKSIKFNKILKQNFSRGYLILGLTNKNRKRKTERVHRLVLFAFKEELYEENKECNHINNIRTDNRAINLEWVLHKENSRKMYMNDHYNKKLKSDDVIKIKQMIINGLPGILIAEKFNVSKATISEIKAGKKWVDI